MNITTLGAALLFGGAWAWPAAASFVASLAVYYTQIRRVSHELAGLSYLARCADVALALERIPSPAFAPLRDALSEWASQATAVRRRTFSVFAERQVGLAGVLTEYVRIVLLRELIDYEVLKRELWSHRRDMERTYDALGLIDGALSIALFRQSLAYWAVPSLAWENPHPGPRLSVTQMVHPLLPDARPNDLPSYPRVLLTGSNASGKSTFLKAVAINVIIAQTLCTAAARVYDGTLFRVVTSMNTNDCVMSGRSYFVNELASLLRILQDATNSSLLVCVDELLRGTNAVDRIALSAEVLKEFARYQLVCFATTHDVELTHLLRDHYRNMHFGENPCDGGVEFDFRLREGPAPQRNALRLAEAMGFPPHIVEKSRQAARYLEIHGKRGVQADEASTAS